MSLDLISEIYSYFKDSWYLPDERTAIKLCDKSFFEHHGMGIPKETMSYWAVSSMESGQRKNIKLLYNGAIYDAHFTVDPLNRVCLFWGTDLKKILEVFYGAEPTPIAVYTKLTDDGFKLDIVIGSRIESFAKHKTWVVPCNPKVYNCAEAFPNLLKVNWHQSLQLKNIRVGDIVFIYSSSPVRFITHQCVVSKVNLPKREIDDRVYYSDPGKYSTGPFIELICCREFDQLEGLSFQALQHHGINGNIQSSLKANGELAEHLNHMIQEQNMLDRFGNSNNNRYMNTHIQDCQPQNANEIDEKTASSLSDEALYQIALSKQTSQVKTKTTTLSQKERNPYIAEYAKRRANGVCQLCKQPAPFTDSSGKPYLESHHIVWLANGGEDSINNTVALCPNCHRKMHIKKEPADIAYLTKVASQHK